MRPETKPRIVGIIPARYASVRFPGKILTPICGRPLIQWVVERVQQAAALDEVVVATDDERIAAAVRDVGGRAVMTAPEHPSGTDRVAEAAAETDADIVINIQGDEPLIDAALIDDVARALAEDASWDMATAAAPITDATDVDSASVVKVVWDRDGRALYFSRSPIPHDRDGDAGYDYWRHIGIYGYQAAFLRRVVAEPPCRLELTEKLEQLRALDLGCRMKVIQTNHVGVGVDTPEDVSRVEELLREEME